MTRFLFCLALLVAAFSANAQVRLQGSVANIPLAGARQMALEIWNIDRWVPSTMVSLSADNTFDLQLDAPPAGQYRLRIASEAKIWSDFIIADAAMADPVLPFQLDYNGMTGGPARIVGSPANTLYFNLMDAQRQLNDTTVVRSPAQVTAAQGTLNGRCMEVITQHPTTLIADIAALLYTPRQADYPGNAAISKMTANEFVKAHALEKIPFNHENILYHTALVKHLNRYFNYFERGLTGNKEYIDGVMARRNGNDIVDAFLFKYLLDKMMDYKQDDGLSYLLKWYAPDCTDENPLPNSTQNLLEALKTCAPGKIAPNLVLPALSGQMADLNLVCSNNKLTFMLFWRSTCSHCKEFEPELEKLYAKYHPLGLEVYALSTDKLEDDWRKDLQNHATPWVNVFIPQEQRRAIGRTFPSPSTPTLIALDKDRRVISRLLSRANLDVYLDEHLVKYKSQ